MNLDTETLYRAHAGTVRAAVLSVLRGEDCDVDDACQDAWINIHRALAGTQVDNVAAWVFGCARRAALAIIDRRNTMRRGGHLERVSIDERAAGVPDDAIVSPAAQVLLDEGREQLAADLAWMRSQIATLPRRQAWAMKLRAAGCGVTQIARHMSVTESAASQLVRRGMDTLRARAAGRRVVI